MTSNLQSAILGGIFIGLAATWLYLSIGRIAGVSGIAARAITGATWPLLFVIGLGIGGWLAVSITQSSDYPAANLSSLSWPKLIVGGLLVGFGTRLGSGCTSGHGVCGIARVSPRSMAATCIFLGTGVLVATTVSAI